MKRTCITIRTTCDCWYVSYVVRFTLLLVRISSAYYLHTLNTWVVVVSSQSCVAADMSLTWVYDVLQNTHSQGIDPGGQTLDPLKICRSSMFWPPKSITVFHPKLLSDNSASVDERLTSKMEGQTNFWGALQAVRNRDCWVFGNRWRRV